MRTMSATELARNTRKVLDSIAGRGESVAIERNNIVVAKIVPSEQTMTAAQALAGFQPMLTMKQATDWLRDSKEHLDHAVFDPWA
jgi:antitoxin (DNA-binding transcriptional repressor) of toxin-antitoxin stability system